MARQENNRMLNIDIGLLNRSYGHGRFRIGIILNTVRSPRYGRLTRRMQLAKHKPAQALLAIKNQGSWFNKLVNSRASRAKMNLICRVISSACKATMHKKDMLPFITALLHSKLISELLPEYLNKVPHMNKEHKLGFLRKIVVPLNYFLNSALTSVYILAIEKLDVCINSFHIALGTVLQQLPSETVDGGYQEILAELADLQTIQEMYVEDKKKARAVIENPPGNFRQMSSALTAADLGEDVDPSLCEINISGQYTDGEHNMKVYFRLLSECFIGLLRDEIAKYHQFIGATSTGRGACKTLASMEDMNVYRRVKLHHVEITKLGKVHVLQLDVADVQNVVLENSKTLQYGSLLCISPDDFRNIALATVVRRKVKDLKNGRLGIQIIEGIAVLDSPKFLCSEFILAESPSYFEAVGPTLRGLQALASDQLPFNKYIIELNTNMDPPNYATPEMKYDLSPLLCKPRKDNKNQLLRQKLLNLQDEKEQWVPILHADKWPNEDEFGFDDSQLRAFKAALTRQLAIIQGPAGTGKTFLGLKIVKTLIHNRDAWITRTAPILILCYTNNALDQFLEGILEEVGPKRIVRVGRSSHFMKLEPYNLKGLRNTEVLNTYTRTMRQGSQKSLQNFRMKLIVPESEEDFGILKNAAIVGITIADSVKYLAVLKVIRPQIIIVKEAAEICEAHIVTALTPDCDHLILIGDQQLKPNPNVYKLEQRYNLDVSLSERLLKNGIPHECLKVQHRMRPEIARLLVPNIYKELYSEPSDQLRPTLRLLCQKHSDFTVEAKTAADFKMAPERGCRRPCDFRLPCGHQCLLFCHSYDPEHITEKTRCRRPCVKTCMRGHGCAKMCYEKCNCLVEGLFTFKSCGHIAKLSCYQAYNNVKCTEMCKKRLSCGHKCHNKCIEKCEYMCQVEVAGHCKHIRVRCSEKYLPKNQKCSITCSKKLSCGHTCSGTCDDCHQGRFHKQCQCQLKKMQKVRKRIGVQIQRNELWTEEIKAKLKTMSAPELGTIKTKIEQSLARHVIPGFQYILLNNLVTFVTRIQKFHSFIAAMESRSLPDLLTTHVRAIGHHWAFKTRLKVIRYYVIPIQNWILKMVPLRVRKYVSEQQLNDVKRELHRVACLIKLFQMLYVYPYDKTMIGLYYKAMSRVDSTKPFTEDKEKEVKGIITEMKAIGMDSGVCV